MNDAEVDCWIEEPGKRAKFERVGDNARITIYDIDGSSRVTATIAYWRWERVLRVFWPPTEEIDTLRDEYADHPPDYRSDAEWMATYILGRLPDLNTMTPTEIADYEQKLQRIVERIAAGIGRP